MKGCEKCRAVEEYEIEVIAVMTQVQVMRRRMDRIKDYLATDNPTIEGVKKLI